MKIKIAIITYLLCCYCVLAHATFLSGKVLDTMGRPLIGVSVSLLYPSDSTLATFAITNKEGSFTIHDATEKHYLLQAAITGYFTEYVTIDLSDGITTKIIPDIRLEKNTAEQSLKEVIISGERVPIKIKGDTVEYNAGSYRVKPNAPVEDLLLQLPGVQVDEKGNIKSMGKDVKKVLVDGKDFFGTDPKIATKNLPADAIDKIQTFGKHSDQSEFSGIDDGTRDQTINLQLKEGKRKGYFGDVKGGLGTTERYDAGAKIFKFRPKTQLAALGSLNNINQFGFSFDDYINFNGGMGNLMNGGSLNDVGDMPVDFGQPITGANTSGALGLNYSVELKPKNRFNINFISSGLSKTQESNTLAQSYLPSGVSYNTIENNWLKQSFLTNNLSSKWNNQIDSFNQVIFTVNAQAKNSNGNNQANSIASLQGQTINTFNENNQETGTSFKYGATGSWVHKLRNTNWKLIETNASINYVQEKTGYDWDNTTHYIDSSTALLSHQFQNNDNKNILSAINVATAYRLRNNIYIAPKLSAESNNVSLIRQQGNVQPNNEAIDSLSPQVSNQVYALAPAVSIKNGSQQQQWNIGLEVRKIWMTPTVNNSTTNKSEFEYLLPFASWRKELGQNKSLEINYNTHVQTPRPDQLSPVLYYSSPLSGIKGSTELKPEYQNNLNFSYMHFNQFAMSSIFINVGGQYIINKISTAIDVLPNLSQQAQWINTPYDANVHFDGSYSCPIKKLGIDINVDINELIQMSESPVNGVDNRNTAFTHKLGGSLSNRKKKDKWTVRVGGDIQISDSRYSISQAYNSVFYNYSGFGYISYKFGKKWFFALDGKLKYYTAQSFDGAITIPLLSAEITRYVLPMQRGSISLKAFDLLNKNESVIRQGLRNNLVEQTSNVMRQYFMLTLTYKLTKVGS